jgi:uncharacterized protein YggE
MTNATDNTLSLRGSVITSVKPDKVKVSLGLESTNKTANAALDANSKIITKLLMHETSTSSFSISPNYNYNYSQQQSSDITARKIIGLLYLTQYR